MGWGEFGLADKLRQILDINVTSLTDIELKFEKKKKG